MKVYLPSWNGDFRLEESGEWSRLVLHEPTPREREIVGEFVRQAARKGWTNIALAAKTPYDDDKMAIQIAAPLGKASKLLIKLARPGDRTLTAVKFSDGMIEIVEGATSEALTQVEEKVEEARKTERKEKPAAAASVKRPTPSCPNCMPGAITPASEVLLSFLSPEEHSDWSRRRAIVVEGGLTGHRYLLAHRNSKMAARIGRICYDLDDKKVVHFHDWSVPPEEEVLAAKLILQHREPWLRNEATLYQLDANGLLRFKNPFGDRRDGTESAMFASSVGGLLMDVAGLDKNKIDISDDGLMSFVQKKEKRLA